MKSTFGNQSKCLVSGWKLYLLLLLGICYLPIKMVYGQSDQMTDELKLQIHNECERLSLLFYDYLDYGQALKTVDLFTDDATLKVGPGVGEWQGKDSFRGSLEARKRVYEGGKLTIHQQDNFLLTSIKETEARGQAYVTVYRAYGKPGQGEPGKEVAVLAGPEVVGQTKWHCLKTDLGWKLGSFEITYIFSKFPQMPGIFLTPEQFKEYENMNYSSLLEHATSVK